MSDLIKREDAIKAIKQWRDNDGSLFDVGLNQAIREIKRLPSADRPQGEWMVADEDGWANGTHALICSECGEGYHLNFERVIGDWNFCPNCGARMKGANNERGR